VVKLRALTPRAYAWGVALVLASGMWALNPAFCTVFGLLVGGLLLVASVPGSARTFSASTTVAALLLVGSAVWFAVTSAFSVNPLVSFVGLFGVHTGTALWVLAGAWFLAGMFGADSRSLRWTLAAVSIAGGIYTLLELAEKFGLTSHRLGGEFAAGAFENSNSLGAFLAVAVIASVAWALVARDLPTRVAAGAAGVLALVGILAASSRTGLLGIAAAAIFAALVAFVPPAKAKLTVLAGLAPLAAMAVSASLVAASEGAFGAAATRALSSLGSDRDVVWRSVAAHIARSPWMGSGLDQFSAITRWSVPGDSVQSVFTTDPHSVVFAVLLGGGIVALLLTMAAFGALAWVGAEMHDAGRRSIPLALIAALPAGLLGMGLVNWLPPAAVLASFAILGAAAGAASSHPAGQPARRAAGRAAQQRPPAWLRPASRTAAYMALTGSLVLFLASVTSLPQEIAVKSADQLSDDQQASVRLVDAYGAWPDPAAAGKAFERLTGLVWLQSASAASADERLLTVSERDARWDGEVAMDRLLAIEALDQGAAAKFGRFEAAVALGALADPASGLWYSVAAHDANVIGLSGNAATWATRALVFPVDDATRALLVRIQGGRSSQPASTTPSGSGGKP
jgi:O-antigen ligase